MKQICAACGQVIQKRGQPRTTGYRSQNHRIRGFCAAISEQVREKNPRWTPRVVHNLMKMMAVQEKVWPCLRVRDPKGQGLLIPISEADATKEEAAGLIQVIQEFADRNNFWLWEYNVLGERYKSLGGRSQGEMIEYEKKYGKIS